MKWIKRKSENSHPGKVLPTKPSMQPNIFFEHQVAKKSSEMNKNKSELFPFPKLLNPHLLRTRIPGYLEIVMLREKHTFFIEIFSHLLLHLIYGNTNEKQGVGFAKIYLRFFCAQKWKKFSTHFRAISRKLRFCAKMRENLSARKFLRIR